MTLETLKAIALITFGFSLYGLAHEIFAYKQRRDVAEYLRRIADRLEALK